MCSMESMELKIYLWMHLSFCLLVSNTTHFEAVSNLIDNLKTCNLIGTTFEIHGKLKLKILPFNPDGSKDLAFVPDEPNDVKYVKLDFIV